MHTTALLLSLMFFVAPPPPPSASAATVALVDKLPEAGARAAILRSAEPRADVILLTRAEASAENLAAALALLTDIRGRSGSADARHVMIVLKSTRLDRPLDIGQRLRMDAHLARLKLARPRAVPGLGTVPAIEMNVTARSGVR